MADLSPQYMQQTMQHDMEIMRTTGRQLEFSGILVDVVMGFYTVLICAYIANSYRLNVYTPDQMQPFNTHGNTFSGHPYWRVFSPAFLSVFTVWFCYMLCFYRRGILLIFYLVVEALLLAWLVVCWAYLIADWLPSNCPNRLWCPCITAYTQVGGVITYTGCLGTSNTAASDIFIANFFLLLGVIILKIVSLIMGVWIYNTYSVLLRAKQGNNPMRDISGYSYSTISSESGDKYNNSTYNYSSTKKMLPPLTAKKGTSREYEA